MSVPIFEFVKAAHRFNARAFVRLARGTTAGDAEFVRAQFERAAAEGGCQDIDAFVVETLPPVVEMRVAGSLDKDILQHLGEGVVNAETFTVEEMSSPSPSWVEVVPQQYSTMLGEMMRGLPPLDGLLMSLPVRLVNRTHLHSLPVPRVADLVVVDGHVLNVAANPLKEVRLTLPPGEGKVVTFVSAVTTRTRRGLMAC